MLEFACEENKFSDAVRKKNFFCMTEGIFSWALISIFNTAVKSYTNENKRRKQNLKTILKLKLNRKENLNL